MPYLCSTTRSGTFQVLLFAALAIGAAGCATPQRANEIELLSPRQIRAFTRHARNPRAFLFSIRMDPDEPPVFIDAHRQVSDHTAILPFEALRQAPIPLIQVRANEHHGSYWALIDSTASENWTSIDRAAPLNLTPIQFEEETFGTEPGHVEDMIPGLLSASPVLMLGTLRMEAVLFFARTASGPLWPLSRSPVSAQADAVLGIPFLRSFSYVQWDFPRREMVFSATQPYEPDPDALLATLSVVSFRNGLEVMAHLDGEETRVLLDTAGDFSVAMPQPSQPQLPQLRLGNLVARQVRTVPSHRLHISRTETPRIGVQWLSAYRITLDNDRRVVYIESP